MILVDNKGAKNNKSGLILYIFEIRLPVIERGIPLDWRGTRIYQCPVRDSKNISVGEDIKIKELAEIRKNHRV